MHRWQDASAGRRVPATTVDRRWIDVQAMARRRAWRLRALRKKLLRSPTVLGALVRPAVMQAGFSFLPKFDGAGIKPVAAPKVRPRHRADMEFGGELNMMLSSLGGSFDAVQATLMSQPERMKYIAEQLQEVGGRIEGMSEL